MLLALQGGAYEARDVIADAQRQVNLLAEVNPANNSPPVSVTHYPTPGLRVITAAPTAGAGRGLYTDITGTLWAVIGTKLYQVDNDFVFHEKGTLTASTNTPVSISDNETVCYLVDGTLEGGYTWEVGTGIDFEKTSDPNFQGSTFVDFLNTFLLFNKPGSPQFYTTTSNTTTFNSLYFGNMTGSSTDLLGAIQLHGIIWLIGKTGSEIWFTSVDPNNPALFPFQRMPDQVLHQGCAAPYSIARLTGIDDSQTALFWLANTKDGRSAIVMAQGYATKRISTHAIENSIMNYSRIDDAVGWTYQQEGHSFYVLNFPTADVTWCFDMSIGLWHQRSWLDPNNGIPHRHRAQCATFAYGKVVALDWEDGTLYELSLDQYTDQRITNGITVDGPIQRVRSFPHLTNELKRTIYARFVADVDVGNSDNPDDTPMISLRWSDTRGHSWSNPVIQPMGKTGQYGTNVMWTRLGMARDRVFELSWSSPVETALNGAYVEPIPLAT